MNDSLQFKTRNEFREWLEKNAISSKGVWLLFEKSKDMKTIKANEALEEALCYGWIDGLMKKVDENSYIKYFSERTKNSKWSQKNKETVIHLEKLGLMSNLGRNKVKEAQENGQWEKASKPSDISDEQIEILELLLKENKVAFDNFKNMSLSVKKTYTRAYMDAKTEKGQKNRLIWMIERLEKNLKPM